MTSSLNHMIRRHYRNLDGYVSAGMETGKDSRKLFMNANENPYELEGFEGENRYPEPQPQALLDVYGTVFGIDPACVLATRGSGEGIAMLVRLFCEPGEDSILVMPPTFGMFGFNAGAMPAHVVEVPLRKEAGSFSLDVNGTIETVTADPSIRLVFICNPNNPTGTAFPQEEVRHIATALEGKAVIVLDEAYSEFSHQGGMVGALQDHSNLVILKTMSKAYGLAGHRMGAVLCADRSFVRLMQAKVADPYPVPHSSVRAANHLLSCLGDVRNHIRSLVEERNRLSNLLQQRDIVRHVYPSEANFLLIEMERAGAFLEFCMQHDVILRDFSTKPLTQDCVRISIGLPEQNDRVVALLDTFSEEENG